MNLNRLYHLRDWVFPSVRRLAEQGMFDIRWFCNQTDCKTTFCIFGYAMQTPQLIADGWYYALLGDTLLSPVWNRYRSQGFCAIADYYDISPDEVELLFAPLTDIEPHVYDLFEEMGVEAPEDPSGDPPSPEGDIQLRYNVLCALIKIGEETHA